MIYLYVVLGIVVLVAVVMWVIYNRLVNAKNVVEEAFSGIDIQLKKRFELIPNLIEAVKGYNAHEAKVLQDIVESRAKMGTTPKSVSEMDSSITGSLRNFRIHVEAYPDLQANTQFIKLMDSLSEVENELSMARRYYNGTVRDLNNTMEVFPNVLFASTFGFKPEEFYEIKDAERLTPVVDLGQQQ